jgi:hypothetical protein
MISWDGFCQRCFKPSMSSIMSMMNTALICPSCKKDERSHPDYVASEAADLVAYAARMIEAGCPPAQVASVREQARKLLEDA